MVFSLIILLVVTVIFKYLSIDTLYRYHDTIYHGSTRLILNALNTM